MNDFMYEQLVARKAKASDYLIRVLVIAVIVLFLFFGPAIIGFFAFPAAICLALAAYFFIFPRLKVEYEYILLNHELQIDIIYNKTRRKSLLEFDILKVEAVTRKDSASPLSGRIEKKYDCSSGSGTDAVYAVVAPVNQQIACILLEPDQTMRTYMNNWLAPHTQLR